MSSKTDFKKWIQDVQYWVRIKSVNPQYFIEDDESDYPLGEMFNNDWSAGDVADEIVRKVNWNDPGYDAWTLDYHRESTVTMDKDTLWQEIYDESK